MLDRRAMLESDIAPLERSDEHGWEEIKASIEHDIGRRAAGKI